MEHHAPPIHRLMQGPACPSTKSPIQKQAVSDTLGLHDTAAVSMKIISASTVEKIGPHL